MDQRTCVPVLTILLENTLLKIRPILKIIVIIIKGGLNPHIQVKEGDSMKERWRHLSLLVDFVFEMKSTLDRINKESYNQFVLRIGT